MRRLLSFVLYITISLQIVNAQDFSNGIIRFMNIPVDGPKEIMKKQLEERDFKYNMFEGCYQGKFNGKNVSVLISTNHNNVDRICVVYPEMSEIVIKSEYNYLLQQFQTNNKYLSLPVNKAISEGDNIKYEISLRNKAYSCSFLYLSPDVYTEDERVCIKSNLERMMGKSDPFLEEISTEMTESLISCFNQRENDILPVDKVSNLFAHIRDGIVSFVLNENNGIYRIVIYYDNMVNRPHGEDL